MSASKMRKPANGSAQYIEPTCPANGAAQHVREPLHSAGSHAGEVRKFTWRELSGLNERHNAHIAYRGKVYDVSAFVSQHPGGVDQILCAAGRDITQVFEAYHNPEIIKIIDKYYVGDLIDNEHPVFPEMGLFYRTLKQRVNQYLKDHNLDRKVDFISLMKDFVITVIVLSTWSLAVGFGAHSLTIALLSALICGVFTASFLLSTHHDANHCSITHKPWVWRCLQLFAESVIGISSYCWKHEHNLGHHPYTNMDPDPDIASPEEAPVWRVKRSQPWRSVYLLQQFYMPLLYCFMGVQFRLVDFVYLYKGRRSQIRMNPLTPVQMFMFWTGKIVFCLYKYIVPYYFMPFWNLVLINMVCDIAFSLAWGNMNMVNHLTTEVVLPPKPDEKNVVNADWAELQVITTCDYCTDSWVWFMVTGGITHQAAHHLFPDMAQAHYLWVTPLLKETCKEFGIKYNHFSSFTEAWKRHVVYLKNMGRDRTSSEKSG